MIIFGSRRGLSPRLAWSESGDGDQGKRVSCVRIQEAVRCPKDREVPTVKNKNKIKITQETSLVAQWLRIHLPMQGTRVRSLFWEDPTRHGATKPVRHNY